MAAETIESFLDIEKAIQDWGELMCAKNARTRKQKEMRRRQFTNNEMVMDVQIDWSHLSVSHETIWREASDTDFKKSKKREVPGRSDGAGDRRDAAIKRTAKPADTLGHDVNVLFETDFKNDSDVTQEYTLKIEKTTNSSCTTEVESGVTRGVELSATLSVGDFVEASAGFSHEVSLTKTEGETIETAVTWGAESTVSVPARNRATARMQVLEKQQCGGFSVYTTMTGYVIIKYISLKNNKLVFGHSGKIDSIVKEYIKLMKENMKKYKPGIEFPKDSSVEFRTDGICRFKFGIKQVIAIEQESASRGAANRP